MADDRARRLGDQRHDRVAVAHQRLDQIGLERRRKGGDVHRADRRRVARLRRPECAITSTLMSGASSAFMPITL